MKPPRARSFNSRGTKKWFVWVSPLINGGKASRPEFETKAEADKHAKEIILGLRQLGERFEALKAEEKWESMKFHQVLAQLGMSYPEAIRIITTTIDATIGNLTKKTIIITDGVSEFLKYCDDKKLDEQTVREYRSHLLRLGKDLGNKTVSQVTKEDLYKWLEETKVKDRTRYNYITTLRRYFNYLVEEEYIAKNPADRIPKPKLVPGKPGILTVEQMGSFVSLIGSEEPRLIAPVALSLFAGVRIVELSKMTWDCISMSKKKIFIDERCAKQNFHRIIPMSDVLFAWLMLCKNRTGRVMLFGSKDQFYSVRLKFAKKAGIKKWPPNAMRHSFASYSWSLDGNENTISNQMGNSPYIAKRHYRAVVEDTEGKRFFETFPENPDQKDQADKPKKKIQKRKKKI